MDRRTVITAGLATGLGLPLWALDKGEGQGKVSAISEGGPLTPPKDRPLVVLVPISEWNTWIDFVGPQAVFQIFHPDPVEQRPKPRFKMFLVAEKAEPIARLVPDYTFENAPPADIILVGAQKGSQSLLDWLKKRSATAQLTLSVCTGAWHLAAAGLLDGKKATTHHSSIDDFKKEFPKVEWVGGMRFVEAPTLSTGGGLTAGIDLALRVTERYFGRDWALHVADALEYQGKGWIV